MFAEVILSISHSEIDKIFDYAIPENLLKSIVLGVRVYVPFGARNTKTEGYVIGLKENSEVSVEKIKQVLSVIEEKPIFTEELLNLGVWMKEQYYTTLSQCLGTIMPSGIHAKNQWLVKLVTPQPQIVLTKQEQEIIDCLKQNKGVLPRLELLEKLGRINFSLKELEKKKLLCQVQKTQQHSFIIRQKMVSLCVDSVVVEPLKIRLQSDKRMASRLKILEYLQSKNGVPIEWKELKKTLNVTDTPIEALVQQGIIMVSQIEERRNSLDYEKYEKTAPFLLTQAQSDAMKKILEQYHSDKKKPILLHGITGSGKTEIYLQMIEKVIEDGKSAIVLVPEISLTPQTVERFVSRFGQKVSVTHSRLNAGERYDQWKKAREHEISVMIGPRSAVFTPFDNLGMIIIDEEHETTYKSDTTPKYDAREVAQKRCEAHNALLLSGSATPSLNSYYQAIEGNSQLITLKQRAKSDSLPEVAIIDMRKELENGNYSIFSTALQNAIMKTLSQKQQIMLFLNRRGYSTFVSCRKCGHVMVCDNCNVSYTYHAKSDKLVCHYCGKKISNPKLCPQCGSKYIKYFGTGTQKVEQEIQKLFPQARVLRMDLDTTGGKHSIEELLEQFSTHQADILVGTQMIAKGHDFSSVTLVGIIAADLSLNSGDYRASETTFSLITQVAGRAGRDKQLGYVLIQTYQPDNYCIRHAASQDYKSFYQEEIQIRKQLNYPPFSHVFSVLVTGADEKKVVDSIKKLTSYFYYYNRKNNFQILGPTPAAISKINKQYRWRLLIKCEQQQRLRAYVMYCIEKYQKEKPKDIFINLTLDPLTIV